MKRKTPTFQNLQQKQFKREIHSYPGLPQETRKTPNGSNSTPKWTRKRTDKLKVNGRKEIEIVMIRVEINKIEICKKKKEKSIKLKLVFWKDR